MLSMLRHCPVGLPGLITTIARTLVPSCRPPPPRPRPCPSAARAHTLRRMRKRLSPLLAPASASWRDALFQPRGREIQERYGYAWGEWAQHLNGATGKEAGSGARLARVANGAAEFRQLHAPPVVLVEIVADRPPPAQRNSGRVERILRVAPVSATASATAESRRPPYHAPK